MSGWRHLTLSPSLSLQPGDIVSLDSDYVVRQRRGGVIIAERPHAFPGAAYTPAQVQQATVLSDAFFFSTPTVTAMISATVQSIAFNADGSVDVTYADGSGNAFSDRASLISYAQGIDDAEVCKKMLLRAWLHRSPGATDSSWAVNKTAQLDLSLELNQLSIGTVQ